MNLKDLKPLLLVLFLHFRRKTRLIKWASVCVCLCVYVCMCVSVCVCVSVYNFSPPINFQTSYPIDTKFWLHIVSYRDSPTALIPFLNFENCARSAFSQFSTLVCSSLLQNVVVRPFHTRKEIKITGSQVGAGDGG